MTAPYRRNVPDDFNREGDAKLVEHLLRTKSEGCELVFVAIPEALGRGA